MYRILLAQLLLLFSFLSVASGCGAANRAPTSLAITDKRILVLHSYGPDYSWTTNLNDGIRSVFSRLHWSNSVRVEYMDSKNIATPDYFSRLAEIYRLKYSATRFDAILTTDNNGLLFLARYRQSLFGDTPVVATGINGAKELQDIARSMTIIPEVANHEATLRQAIALRPHARNGYIIVDETVTGKAILGEVLPLLELLPGTVQFHVLEARTLHETIETVSSIDSADFIYLLPYFRDSSGQTYPQGHGARALARASPAPIFVSWAFQLGTGTLGGEVVSGVQLGEYGAQAVLDILRGQQPQPPPPIGLTMPLYDYAVVQQFHIPDKLLPADTSFINRPPTLFARYGPVLIPALGVIALLAIFLVLLLRMLRSETLVNQRNQEIIALNNEVIGTQRELVATLGEVIETRSQETGHHVQRVARISRLLGEKAGLGPDELDVLEAASPLHDVGKIGIPDEILHRPGKLSNLEILQIQRHTVIGKDILKYSDRRLLSAACAIAYQHHERWDGSGYPEGLAGEDIHIFARITALADVYDALSMARCYKQAWPEERVLRFIRRERGSFFDPHLVDIFLSHRDDIRAIRLQLTEETQ